MIPSKIFLIQLKVPTWWNYLISIFGKLFMNFRKFPVHMKNYINYGNYYVREWKFFQRRESIFKFFFRVLKYFYRKELISKKWKIFMPACSIYKAFITNEALKFQFLFRILKFRFDCRQFGFSFGFRNIIWLKINWLFLHKMVGLTGMKTPQKRNWMSPFWRNT